MTIASFTQQGPKLARTWTFKQTSNGEDPAAAADPSTNSTTVNSSTSLPDDAIQVAENNVNAQGAVFYFPQDCKKANGMDGSQCSRQVVEKSVVLEDAPEPRSGVQGQEQKDGSIDSIKQSKAPEPKTFTLPQTCEILKDGTKLCEQKIIMELYLPIEEAEKELEQVLSWNDEADATLFSGFQDGDFEPFLSF